MYQHINAAAALNWDSTAANWKTTDAVRWASRESSAVRTIHLQLPPHGVCRPPVEGAVVDVVVTASAKRSSSRGTFGCKCLVLNEERPHPTRNGLWWSREHTMVSPRWKQARGHNIQRNDAEEEAANTARDQINIATCRCMYVVASAANHNCGAGRPETHKYGA